MFKTRKRLSSKPPSPKPPFGFGVSDSAVSDLVVSDSAVSNLAVSDLAVYYRFGLCQFATAQTARRRKPAHGSDRRIPWRAVPTAARCRPANPAACRQYHRHTRHRAEARRSSLNHDKRARPSGLGVPTPRWFLPPRR